MCTLPSVLVTVLLWCSSTHLVYSQQQAAPADEQEAMDELGQLDQELEAKVRQLGNWDEQYALIEEVINNVWTDNGWNDEADRVARDAALQISRIPPWEFNRRIDTFYGIIRQRYELTPQQVDQLQKMMMQEMMGMMFKYGSISMQHAGEILDTRLSGQPFTPEQVARWIKEFDPYIEEYQRDVDRLIAKFREQLTPEQQKIFELDAASFRKRFGKIMEMREQWREGLWKPSDWGLQNDPLHRGLTTSQPVTLTEAAAPLDNRVLPYDETTWGYYVLAFIRHYHLDAAQQQAAISIHRDLLTQAKRYRLTHFEALAAIPREQQADHPLLAPICEKFAELQKRLDLLPTSQQRTAIDPAAAPLP
ncbi:MAG: hypothetical protein HJJLKODD_02954 [Phycisphaerae bacterium]|nr:hypothetical protein [Phycisphaerae bacterium]